MPSPATDVPAEFLVLGPVDVVRGGASVRVASGRTEVVLAMLLLEAGRVIPFQRLVAALWGDAPPSTARSQVQICVSVLRRRLAGTGAVILTQPPGYLLRIPDGSLDLWRFRELCTTAESLAEQRPEEAAARYREALALWRGEACASVASQVVMQAAIRLNEERWIAQERRMALELRLGRHQQVAAELAHLVAAEPLREGLRALLMLALYRSGRRAEALEAYRSGRRLMIEELGTDPGKELRALEQAILTGAPSLDISQASLEVPGDVLAAMQLPRQLPGSVADFVGRDDLVKLACAALQRPADTAGETGAVPVVLLTGRGGIGKTTLALRIAHGIRGDFPDGQLFARLRQDGSPATHPAGVLEQFLRSLGVPASAVPDRLEARTAMFRSCLAGHRMLIVLDDAASVSQVEPLLPGESDCGVIITSRTRLALPGAIQLEVGVLDKQAAVELLDRVVGADRVASEPDAAAELIRLCEGLPLALRIVTSKLAVRRHWQISRMVERLTDEQHRLNELDLEGTSIRATLEVSYRSLPDTAQVLLNRLGLLDQAEFPAWISAPLLDIPIAAAEEVLENLVTAGLIEARTTDSGAVRYRIHDMIRLFSREKLAAIPLGAERLAPVRRYLGCWLYLISAAHRRLHGGDFHVVHGDAPLWSPPDGMLADVLTAPLDWFRTEGAGLIEAVLLAARAKLDEFCWDLAVSAVAFFELGGYSDEWQQTHEAALSVVTETGNNRGTAALLHSLGLRATSRDIEQASNYLRQSLTVWRQTADPHGEALALVALANVDWLRGEFDAAAAGYAQALRRFTEVGDPAGQASALRGQGQVAMERGDYAQSLTMLERSISLSQRVGASRDAAQSMYYSGELLLRRGDFDQAEKRLCQVAAKTRELGDIVGEGYALLSLANVRTLTGQLPQVFENLRQADALARKSGDLLLHARVLLAIGEFWLVADSPDLARNSLIAAKATLSVIGSPPLWQARLQDLERKLELLT